MSTSLAQLITRTRVHASILSSSAVTDDELTPMINASGGELWDLLATRYEDWLTTPDWTTFALTGSQYQATLPSDCVKLDGVDRWDGSDWVPLRRISKNQRGLYRSGGPANFLYPSSYDRMRGYYQVGLRTIELVPSSDAAGTYRYRYVQGWQYMSSSNQTVDLPNGWDEVIVVDAAIKCLNLLDRESSGLERMKAQLLRRIENAAQQRDAQEPEFICDPNVPDWWTW